MIRKTAIALVLGMAGLGVAVTAAHAQYGDRRYDGGGRGWLPRGSWEQSCTNGRMDGPVLRARCDDSRGVWRYSQIDVRQCRGRYVSNNFGRLVCGESDPSNYNNGWNGNGGWGGGGGWGGNNWENGRLPGGSWGASCRDARMSGSVLYARCENDDGRWFSTQLDMRQCRSNRARNNYGNLGCD